jgi:CBS-domain-containing membrane protein
MDPNPTVLHPSDRVRTAVGYIMEHRYRSLPVVDEEGRFLGVFGVNCLLRQVLPKAVVMEYGLDSAPFVRETLSDLHRRLRKAEDQPISICMQEEVSVVRPDCPLVETLLTLYKACASLPVVEPETHRLVGVVSYWDAGRKILEAEV